ncbi:precorrin-6y C5,15-methyltransferase (decarboxylating) subunit CbiE [Lysinibacillus yapensis]|uniref:Precorrin-6y C5,15-methyltransferase (Decarboxylating) subunit CbiE n=1 Tax=Ureibacillus yapensis TaxID=2304605 RepID=A0A396SFV0_9BACL|nr:precorrin-6y C5,15-methyltransferase (decarboxylating) subunit CbiE [Lysinibacillus yapensis]RHW40165.1 precorrin-6y C5,15-methyltransferase (decarboxylating) subunit CbiE [Lysinibacillus yapensis]
MKMIGIGDNGAAGLLPQYIEWVEQSEVLVGGERQLDFFPSYTGQKIVIKGGLSRLVEQLQAEQRKTVILASGDPLFYGIGSYLSKKIPLEIYPYASSLQLAFSRLKESWQDAYIVSLHGRTIKGLAQKIDGRQKVAILTDEDNSPIAIANYLKHFGMTEYEMFIAENLEGEHEQCRLMTLDEVTESSFSPLNIVILRQTTRGPVYPLGIEDEEFSQRKPDKGLITKKEIRVLSLQAMNLEPTSIVWDIGTCTGSMAIEAGKLAKEGAVFAIEKNEGDLANCHENQQKFRVDITAIHGKAPDRLEEFPDPNSIFIGGSGGEMQQLLTTCIERLQPNGRLVMNLATIENLYEAVNCLKELQCDVSILQAQLSRSKPILHMTRFVPLNPIYIITASKKGIENA